MARLLRTIFVLLVVCASAAFARQRDGGQHDSPRRLEEARERWERLSPVEQARLRERFDRLRQMPANDRAALEDRAKYLAEAMRQVAERLTPEQTEVIARIDPQRRRALLRDLAMIEGGDRAARVRAALPDALREKLESVPPEQRARMLFEFEHRRRERSREQIGEILSKRFGLSPQEWARIDALPEPERMLEIAKLKRDARGPDAERRGPGDETIAARMRLLSAARPRPSDHLRYAELSTSDRRELVAKIVRERILAILREQGMATPEEIAALDALSLDEFRRAIRERLDMGRGHRGPRPDGQHKR